MKVLLALGLVGITCLAVALWSRNSHSCPVQSLDTFSTVSVMVGEKTLKLKEAHTQCQRVQGLQYINSIPEDGMIFLFDKKSIRQFWMKNTLVPLSVAFIDEDGFITRIHNMPVEKDPSDPRVAYSSVTAVSAAIEVPQGKFKEWGIQVGQKMEVKK